jgi:TRAP-type C4-dicarboxylate transport system permease small subunit
VVEVEMGFLGKVKSLCWFFSDKVDQAVRWICICLIIFMTAEVIVSVFFRYALDSPLKWGEELARLTMVWAGLLGISIALKDGEHIGLEMLTRQLVGRLRAWCNLVTYSLVALFLIVLLIWGVKISQAAWGTFLPALQIRWTWSHLAVPVTAGIQLLHLWSLMLDEIMIISGREVRGPHHQSK